MSAIMLVNGKPHRLCDCDPHKGECPRGIKRTLATTDFSRCLIPAPDALIAGSAVPEVARITDEEIIKAYKEEYVREDHGGYPKHATLEDVIVATVRRFIPSPLARKCRHGYREENCGLCHPELEPKETPQSGA